MSFGEDLKRERELRQISLREVADATKISGRFLDALETNHFKILPAEVFTRGFVREYAKFLGLNQDAVLASYMEERGLQEGEETKARKRKQEEDARRTPAFRPSTRSIPVTQYRFDKNLAMVVLLGVALAGVVGYTTCQPKKDEAAVGAASAEPSSTAAPRPAVATPLAAPAIPATGVTAEIDFIADCWTRIEVDGVEQETGIVPAGERRVLTAREYVGLSLGNAGGVRVRLNGRELPPLGEAGRVLKNVRLDRARAEAATPSAASPAPPASVTPF